MIKCAAIKVIYYNHNNCNNYTSEVFTGCHHSSIYDNINYTQTTNNLRIIEEFEGFVTQDGEFVDRWKAFDISKANKQLRCEKDYDCNNMRLYSYMLK